MPEALQGRRIVIVGDILHSRVARSNLWALTACGADVVLCGPPSLCPGGFCGLRGCSASRSAEGSGAATGPGQCAALEHALPGADAVMTLRLQKERMGQQLLISLSAITAILD